MDENFFYDRLSKLRMEKGVSARDMSLSLGQSENYINKIENRKALPSMTAFFYICEYFKISPMEFFREDHCYPIAMNELIQAAEKLNAEQLRCLTAMLHSFFYKT